MPRVGFGQDEGREKSVVCPVTLFSEHCRIHRPDGGLRLCQGLMEGSRESGCQLMPRQVECFPGSSPRWLTLDLGICGL